MSLKYAETWWLRDSVMKRRGRTNIIITDRDQLGEPGTWKPDSTTTGAYPNTDFQTINGEIKITTNGFVLENKIVNGRVNVQAEDVLIRNCILRGQVETSSNGVITCYGPFVKRLEVIDCTLKPAFPTRFIDGIIGHDYTISRCDISCTVDGMGMFNTYSPGQALNTFAYSNYIHDLAYYKPDPSHADNQSHNDGCQIQGGLGATLKGNNIASYYSTDPNVGTQNYDRPQALSCMLFNNNVGVTGQHVIEDNWFSGGWIPINCGGAPGSNLGHAYRNKFSRDAYYKDGNGIPYTILARADQTFDCGEGTPNQNVWEDDGTPVTIKRNG